MYGSGNEPATVAEFEALFPLDYYDYNPGQVINMAVENIKTVGFNQWDEEWELGDISASNGQNVADATHIRSKNTFEVLPGVAYFFKSPINIFARFYDEGGNYLGYNYGGINQITKDTERTIPSGARLMRFCGSATTYNHDICINISNPSKNGTYEPYWSALKSIDPTALTSGGVQIFPDGMKGVGTAYDEATKDTATRRFGVVDLGDKTFTKSGNWYMSSLPGAKRPTSAAAVPNAKCGRFEVASWSAGNIGNFIIAYTGSGVQDDSVLQIGVTGYSSAAEFQAAMQGVKLIYELATQEVFQLDSVQDWEYRIDYLGTEAMDPENTSAPYSTPLNAEISYPR